MLSTYLYQRISMPTELVAAWFMSTHLVKREFSLLLVAKQQVMGYLLWTKLQFSTSAPSTWAIQAHRTTRQMLGICKPRRATFLILEQISAWFLLPPRTIRAPTYISMVDSATEQSLTTFTFSACHRSRGSESSWVKMHGGLSHATLCLRGR